MKNLEWYPLRMGFDTFKNQFDLLTAYISDKIIETTLNLEFYRFK